MNDAEPHTGVADTDLGIDGSGLRKLYREGGSVDVTLADGGRLYMDRPLPFICVHRKREGHDDEATQRLATTQAAFLITCGDAEGHGAALPILRDLADASIEHFGAFLVLEFWCREDERRANDPYDLQPAFQVYTSETTQRTGAVDALESALSTITIQHFEAAVSIKTEAGPERFDEFQAALGDDQVSVLGVELAPIYRRLDGEGVYPILLDRLRTKFGDALRRAFFGFAQEATTLQAAGYLALGRRTLDEAVDRVDYGLSAIDESFDFLLQTTPVNTVEAWANFTEWGCEREPVFRYRPLPIDPTLLKRRLFELPIEEVEDPSLHWVFREKQEELDRQITMLAERGTRRFFFESLQLYGEVAPRLLEEARTILAELPRRDYDFESSQHLDAEAFAEVAVSDLAHYRASCPDFPETIQIRRDMPPGLMVSRGRLLIGRTTRIPAARVEPLLHHEIGTHMLTYFNGRVQPIRLLYNGLAGYEALQEGLAVLAEYLVGGLNVPRLRVLAARVIAAHCMIDGCSFVDLYRLLRSDHHFEQNEAYSIATRTFRGGGLIKDVIYLRGLHELMHHLQDGGDLETLFVGKMALHHLPVIEEIDARGILRDAPLRPRYLDSDRVQSRLAGVRAGSTFIDLIEQRTS